MKNNIFFFYLAVLIALSIGFPFSGKAQNQEIDSLLEAKRLLQHNVYTDYFKTLYCQATYHPKTKKIIDYPIDFNQTVIAHRSENMEYEHVVPVEAFGKKFSEWTRGHPACQRGKVAYKGRKCAEKTNKIFAYIEADMYNLYPSIGSVNALRLNRPFADLPRNIPSYFNQNCLFKIADNLAEPPDIAKGIVARSYLYLSETYPKWFQMTSHQLDLMIDWHIRYPVSKWECTRTYRIEKIQKSRNQITYESCLEAGLWPDKKNKSKTLRIKNNILKKEK